MSPEQASNAIPDALQKSNAAQQMSNALQNKFLNYIRKSRMPVTVFLVNGVKLQGDISWFDAFSVLLHRDSHSQLVYKHAISTIMPARPIDLSDEIDGVERVGVGAGTRERRAPRRRQTVEA